jgi:signal transduction histidine kinase
MFRCLHPRGGYDGTGIGVAIWNAGVVRRGGVFWVEPGPRGAPVAVTLPAEAVEG